MNNETIAHYKITGKLGQGGMGEVYRATDTKLDREVAIKILPESFAEDRNRVARFNREAKSLAALNHPNIAVIHGIEQAGETHALIMELIEGETLGQRLRRDPMTVPEALDCCKQIAQALEAAHEKGIIHRDLKPENVKISEDGYVKVLDFGLAKEVADPAASGNQDASPTITHMATGPGELLGTAPYMSPEQARARPVDKRSDIWSFGCVLYECLTGKPMFGGEDVTETLASIIKGEPDWAALPEDTPPTIELLIRKCLNKDRKRRLHDIADARIDIEQALGDPSSSIIRLSAGALRETTKRTGINAFLAIGAVVLVALVSILLTWFLKPAPPAPSPPSTKTFSIPLGLTNDVVLASMDPLVQVAAYTHTLSLSRDGSRLACVGLGDDGNYLLFVRHLDTGTVTELEQTQGVIGSVFSPDGQWILYLTDNNELRKVRAEGGPSFKIYSGKSPIFSYLWCGSGILFSEQDTGLMRVPAEGGKPPERLAVPGAKERHLVLLSAVPDRNGVLVAPWIPRDRTEPTQTSFLSLDTLKLTPVLDGIALFIAPSKQLLIYARQKEVFATRYDPDSLKPVGAPASVRDGIRPFASAFAEDGTVAYFASDTQRWSLLHPGIPVWVDREGVETPLSEHFASGVSVPRISPNGRYLAVTSSDEQIQVIDLEQAGPPQQITHKPSKYRRAVWTRDSESLIFMGINGSGSYISTASLARPGLRTLLSQTKPGMTALIPCSTSPVDDLLLYYQWSGTGTASNRSLFLLNYREAASSKPKDFLVRPSDDAAAKFSPDGKWIAFVSKEFGRDDVYVLPYPNTGRPVPVSQGGGTEPVWSHLTKELFYWRGNEFRSATYETKGEFRIVDRKTLFTSEAYERGPWANANYDVDPKKDKFIMIRSIHQPEIKVIVNWFTELNKEVSPAK